MTFNLPCLVALAATYQEIHSVKWTAKIALYYTGLSLVLAFIAAKTLIKQHQDKKNTKPEEAA